MSMTGWSLTEARSLSVKAARGAGYDWGVAEEAGFAIYWLQARGVPGLAALAAMLDDANASHLDRNTCPLTLGCGLSDGALHLTDIKQSIAQPLLLMPFVACAQPDVAHLAIWGATRCKVASTGIEIEGNALSALSKVQFETLKTMPNGECYARVGAENGDVMRRLAVHAHATYAPATEASRLAGAGAGLTDND